jgi:hypothetical protein
MVAYVHVCPLHYSPGLLLLDLQLKDFLDIKQQEAYVLEGLVNRTQAMSTAFQSKAIIWFHDCDYYLRMHMLWLHEL